MQISTEHEILDYFRFGSPFIHNQHYHLTIQTFEL